jgi:hypothetical protein
MNAWSLLGNAASSAIRGMLEAVSFESWKNQRHR